MLINICAIMFSMWFTEIKQCDPSVVELDVHCTMTANCVRRSSREVKTPPHQNIVVLGSLHSMAGHCSLSPPSTPRGSSDIPLSFRIASVRLGHLSQPEPRNLPEKVKDFTKIYKFASVVTMIEIAFVRLHIIIKSLVSLLAAFPLPVGLLQQ